MANIMINGKSVSVENHLTILEAAKTCGIDIPSLCHMENIHKIGSCRICVVEVEGAKTLQAACLTKVSDGMVIHTHSDKVRKARKVLYELLLSDHTKDCLSCRRNQSCELQELGKTLGIEETRFNGERSEFKKDRSVSITRDMSKCILCRRCVTVCNKIQGTGVLNAQNRGFDTVIGPAMDLSIGSVNCAFCGQCTVVCPVGALHETDSIQKVWAALHDESKRVVVQVAPAVRVAIGEEFGYEPGTRVTGKLVSALRMLGFDDVFDTNFAADLTILEEGTELLSRLKKALTGSGAVLPMITSCSPGWIKFVEHTYPKELDHLSTCKSPHAMLGALVKSFFANKINRNPEDLFVVSIMPCTAKKFEITRDEMKNFGVPNVDAVLTTRELASMIKEAGIHFGGLQDGAFDDPLGFSTGAGDIFGLTGGVMEAALRTVYELVTGKELPFENLHVAPIVGLSQIKEAEIEIRDPLPEYQFLSGVTLRVAATSGLKGADLLMKAVAEGKSPYHFIEVMGCPGGCITGGGQPRSRDPEARSKRLKGLYAEDEGKALRKSHENPYVKALYKEFLGVPNGPKSHELLHTRYVRRSRFCEAGIVSGPAGSSHGDSQSPPVKVHQRRTRDDLESIRILALEAENRRLKNELDEALRTVDLFKQVLSDYASKHK